MLIRSLPWFGFSCRLQWSTCRCSHRKHLATYLEHLLIDHMRIAGLQWKVGGEQVQDSMSRLQNKFNLILAGPG